MLLNRNHLLTSIPLVLGFIQEYKERVRIQELRGCPINRQVHRPPHPQRWVLTLEIYKQLFCEL